MVIVEHELDDEISSTAWRLNVKETPYIPAL